MSTVAIGFDDTIHSLQHGQSTQYANFSLWDTYRSLAPLQGRLYPRIGSDLAQSLVNGAVQGGWLPKWPVANDYTGVMNGDNATPFLSSLYAFGARQFDTASALKYMVKGARVPSQPGAKYQERQGIADYQRLGYLPNDRAEFGHVSEGASQTLEYAIDDFTISTFADSLGQRDTAKTFAHRAQNWQNVFDPGTEMTVFSPNADSFLARHYDSIAHATGSPGDGDQASVSGDGLRGC
jgi:putative alpha-1,2-mannosidase